MAHITAGQLKTGFQRGKCKFWGVYGKQWALELRWRRATDFSNGGIWKCTIANSVENRVRLWVIRCWSVLHIGHYDFLNFQKFVQTAWCVPKPRKIWTVFVMHESFQVIVLGIEQLNWCCFQSFIVWKLQMWLSDETYKRANCNTLFGWHAAEMVNIAFIGASEDLIEWLVVMLFLPPARPVSYTHLTLPTILRV